MGVSCFERNGNLTFSFHQNLSSPCGFVISRKPIFGIALKPKEVERNHCFSLKICSSQVVSVLSKGESANRLIDGGVLEKELEFKPSFDEYLKTMESIRTGRDVKQSGHSIRKDKSVDSSVEEDHPRLLSSPEDEGNGPLRVSEERRFGKKSVSMKQKELYKNFNGRGKLKDSGKIGFEEKVNLGVTHRFIRDELDLREMERNLHVKRRSEMDMENLRWRRNSRDGESDTERGSYRKIGWRNQVAGNKPFSKKSNDGREEMERAAFRPFEESVGVLDKPRVSKMEMEERIQKLANCLNGADIDMPEWVFSKMIRSAKIRYSDHSMVRVIQILGKLGNWRRVLQVIEWIQLRERFKSHKIRYIYTAALDVLGKARRPVEALNVFNAMQEHMSTYPDLVAYHCIAITLGQAGHMKELFDVIDTMKSPPKKKLKTGVFEKWDPRIEPDIVVYNSVLNACVQRKQWEGAFWVLQQLKQQNLRPSSTTYGLVMEVMLACEKYNLVHDFFRKVQKSSIPNSLTYKVLVNTLWKEGKTDEAILAVEDMERRGIIGSAGLYYDLARCLCSAGRCQEALVQIDKICKVANKPLVVTYTGLIQACLNSGNIQDGAYIFNHMQRFCSPNLVTCNIMLKSYLDSGMFEEAKALFQKMSQDGNHISSSSEFKERVRPDIYTFNTMLDACLKEQRWDDLEYVYKRMMYHGYHFNEKRHLSLIVDGCRAGKVELLETTWNHLVQADRTPPPLLFKEMLRVKLDQDDFSGAIGCVTSHRWGDSPVFSHKAWLNFFDKNGNRLKRDTLVSFVEEGSILLLRSDSRSSVLQKLITACSEFFRIPVTAAKDTIIISRQLTR